MQRIAGFFFFLGGAMVLLGIITAEIFYPHYNVALNMISNLGATPPPDSVIRQPSAFIFDNAMLVAGVVLLVSVFALRKTYGRDFLFPAILMSLGVLGVGVFPAFHKLTHPIVALLAFLFGGITALVSSRKTAGPFRYLAIILGVISLAFLFLGIVFPRTIVPILGAGGTERFVAYPIILWLIGFGGYLMGNPGSTRKK